MDLEDEDRPAIERVLEATRGARIVAITAATSAAGIAVAQAVIAEAAPTGQPSIWVAAPHLGDDCIVEEVAASIVLELGVPIAPREDEAGLVDAAADALRHAAPAFVVLTEAEAWLARGGASSIATWAEETSATFVVVTANSELALPEGAVRVAVDLRSEAGMAEMLERRWDALTELERRVAACLARCPVAVSASIVASALGTEIGAALDALARDGVITITWTAGELFIRLSADARAIHERRSDATESDEATARHLDEGLCLALLESAPEALDVGELASFRDAEILARQRAMLRALLPRARSHDSGHGARLTLVAMTAMEPLGPLLEVCALAARALDDVEEPALRARLEERQARVLRALGRLGEAIACLERAAPHVDALSPRAGARLALALARMALPELESLHLARRAEEIVATLPRGDALTSGLVANARAAIAWNTVSAEAAVAPMIEAVIGYGQARREQLQVQALQSLAVHHMGAERPREATQLAHRLEREAVRLGRSEYTASAHAYRGCAALLAGDVDEAIRSLSAAIEVVSALGYRHAERWARAHRGLAMLAGGRMLDAARDFEDFIAMSRIVGGSDLVGVIGGALAGSAIAQERLLALGDRDVPPYLRALIRAVRVILTDAPASRAISGQIEHYPPGYFAFEVLQLERAVIRATSVAPVVAAAARTREMLVARDASWFELEGEARISLGRTRTLRQILHGFVVAHARARALDLEDVFLLGWPDERATPASRANRVHVTLSRLRAAGLGEAIAFGEGGWRLDPSLRVVAI